MATPKLTEKVVWAGSNVGSFAMAEEATRQLAEQDVSAGRIRRQVTRVGEARVAEREESVERLKAMDLLPRRRGLAHQEAPQIAVVMMDGGRYQRRDHFAARGESKPRCSQQSSTTHWRETKVGCLLAMTGKIHSGDPCAQIPDSFAYASVVQEIAKMAVNTGPDALSFPSPDDSMGLSSATVAEALPYKPPTVDSRDVVASGESSDAFGWQLEARALQLNFPAAVRQAFVADGARTNWRIQRQHFPDATAIADLVHALSYAWSAAKIDEGEATYQKWAQLVWQGDVSEVIEHLKALQSVYGPPPDDSPGDPRHHVARALTYFQNNASHMDYPEYRQQGLPITSAHIESTVKLINRRIKGSEKFWQRETSEAVLQLRADYLSDSNPMARFWPRYHANQTGSNAYRHASKKPQSA